MRPIEDIFANRKVDVSKALNFGFVEKGGLFYYTVALPKTQMEARVVLKKDGLFRADVYDVPNQQVYLLANVPAARGSFVQQIQTAFEAVLMQIADHCFVGDVFQSHQAHDIRDYIQKTYGDDLEFLWEKFPSTAIVRRQDTRKWYAAFLRISKRKLGINSDDIVDILNVRMEPCDVDRLSDNQTFFRGYHMNKKNWVTVCLNDSCPTAKLCDFINQSYALAGKR